VSVALRQQEPAGLRLEVVEGRDGFVGLERSWNDALGKGPRDEPMLRHEWLRAFLENFFPGAIVRTFVARAGREIAAAVPLIETRERSADRAPGEKPGGSGDGAVAESASLDIGLAFIFRRSRYHFGRRWCRGSFFSRSGVG